VDFYLASMARRSCTSWCFSDAVVSGRIIARYMKPVVFKAKHRASSKRCQGFDVRMRRKWRTTTERRYVYLRTATYSLDLESKYVSIGEGAKRKCMLDDMDITPVHLVAGRNLARHLVDS
jgi:hypothetical protein